MRKISYIQLLNEINSGGTAVVYLGVNTHTGYPVAVKELNSQLFKNPIIKTMFIKEANRYLELDHPNIVKLEDFLLLNGEDTGYLVMEYIEGRNLREYMKEITGPLPIQMAAAFVNVSLDAIGYAHERGCIHMDIKPSNIMLSVDHEIKVIDFGISLDLNKSEGNEIMGTPYYMSPEQIAGTGIDERTDIYSLGITLYELIVGKPPFSGAELSREELLDIIKTNPLPKISSNNTYDKPLLGNINAIIQKSTAKHPDNRYQSCEEFQEDLMEIM